MNTDELSTGAARSAQVVKKREGEKRKSPCTPLREKGKGKEDRRGSPSEPSFARVRTRGVGMRTRLRASLDADLDIAVRAFNGTAIDRRIWARIAWRVGVEEFHHALINKLAEDAADNAPRRPAAAFQAFLNARFPKPDAQHAGETPPTSPKPTHDTGVTPCPQFINYGHRSRGAGIGEMRRGMNCEISESLKALAAEYDRATTQKERDRLMREIARVSDKQERDRDGAHRRDTRQGVFEASMLSLDEHMAKFDDPSKVATFSDGCKGAESIRNGGVEAPSDVIEAVLGRLSERNRAFALVVLGGTTWREMGIGKRGFNKRLSKICSLLGSHPLPKPSL